GDDHGQGAAEALDARELVRERFLALTPVGEAGEAVDEGLPLDDPVEPDVVEGNDGVRREGGRGHPVLVGEIVAEEEQRAEVHGPRTKRHLDLVVALVGIADLHELTVRTDEDAAGRARRLDRGLDDQPHELVAVVSGAERLAEARDDVPQAPALRLQLVETGLQLECHLVERPPEERKLVTALYGHALLEVDRKSTR